MARAANRWLRTLLWLVAIFIAVIAGGELFLTVLVEAGDLLLEGSQAVLLLIFERAFGLPYARAEGLAAWTSLALLALCIVAAVWKLTPWVKAKAAAGRQWVRETRSAAGEWWRAARWYQKSFVAIGGLALLFGLLLVV